MGIKGLPKLISDIAGSGAVKVYNFSKFSGWPVGVDASQIIHLTVIAMRSSGKDMRNTEGKLTSHLHGLFYKILAFLQNGMVPIFVFDGKAPNIKNKTLEKRRSKKMQAEKSLEKLSDSEDEEYIKLFKQTFKPSKEDIREAQILLDLMGIPYIVAPGEADVVLAWLASRYDTNNRRYVEGVCSDDSDMLALGADYLFKDMLRFMRQNKPVKVISLKKALVKMNLTMNQFVDLCVLLGTDYCENIKDIGPKTAYRLIVKYGTLEKVLDHLDKTNEDSDDSSDSEKIDPNIQCMINARNYFRTAVAELDESDDFVITDEQLKLRKYQYEELMDFMCVKHNFDVTRIQTGINRLEEYYQKMEVTRENTKKVHKILQPRSENYIFKALVGDIEFLPSDEEEIPSKKNERKREAIKKVTSRRNIESSSDSGEGAESDMSLSDFSEKEVEEAQ